MRSYGNVNVCVYAVHVWVRLSMCVCVRIRKLPLQFAAHNRISDLQPILFKCLIQPTTCRRDYAHTQHTICKCKCVRVCARHLLSAWCGVCRCTTVAAIAWLAHFWCALSKVARMIYVTQSVLLRTAASITRQYQQKQKQQRKEINSIKLSISQILPITIDQVALLLLNIKNCANYFI